MSGHDISYSRRTRSGRIRRRADAQPDTAWLASYRHCRARTIELNETATTRLARELDVTVESPAAPASSQVRSGWLTGTSSLSVFAVTRQLWREALALLRLRRGGKTLVIADTRRLQAAAFRDGLESHLKTFGSAQSMADLLPRDASLVVFSPNVFPHSGDHAMGDLSVFGYLSLPWIAARHPASFLAALWRAWRKGDKLLWAALSNVLGRLSQTCSIERAILLTSNSYAIELLRWRMLNDPGVASVTEILHGIPSTEMVEYFTWCADQAAEPAKLRFIAPVPDLRLVSSMQVESVAINLKMNDYIATHTVSDGRETVADFRRHGARAYRVALNGSASGSTHYFASRHFAIERRLIEIIRDYSELTGTAIEIAYSVHPAHVKSGLAPHFSEQLPGIVVLLDSIATWLAADLCVAMFSSSKWDAEALGCPTFLTIREDDDIYDGSLLRDGRHIGEAETTVSALRRVLDAMCVRGPVDHADIELRMRRLFGTAAALVAPECAASPDA